MIKILNSPIKNAIFMLGFAAVVYTVARLVQLFILRQAIGSCEGDSVCAAPNDIVDMLFRQFLSDLILVSRILFELGFILFVVQVIRRLLKTKQK